MNASTGVTPQLGDHGGEARGGIVVVADLGSTVDDEEGVHPAHGVGQPCATTVRDELGSPGAQHREPLGAG